MRERDETLTGRCWYDKLGQTRELEQAGRHAAELYRGTAGGQECVEVERWGLSGWTEWSLSSGSRWRPSRLGDIKFFSSVVPCFPGCMAYASRKLQPREEKLSTIEKECLGIVWAVELFRYYLFGRSFVIQTDHNPPIWLNQARDKNRKLLRWSLTL